MSQRDVHNEVRKMVESLPAELQEAVQELAAHMKTQIVVAGHPVGPLALALLGSEMAALQEAAENTGKPQEIQCPNPGCQEGRVDTGGVQPWGAPIYNTCPVCKGKGNLRIQ